MPAKRVRSESPAAARCKRPRRSAHREGESDRTPNAAECPTAPCPPPQPLPEAAPETLLTTGGSASDTESGRSRSRSPAARESPPGSPAPPQPLTEANLEALNRSSLPEASCLSESAPSMSASAASTSADDIAARLKLQAYRIHVDTTVSMPVELQAHIITTHITKARRPEEKVSPYAQRVVDKRADAAKVREDSAIRSLEPALMAGLHGDDEHSFPGVAADFKCKISRALLPCGSDEVRSAYGPLA
ncbi:hypothetical protein DPSP01_014373 [Paraphaeosphaeria sporulosa]